MNEPKKHPRGHCQICGRDIGIGAGVIAHHGYQRPKWYGGQTRSCEGARELPYEVSCDVLRRHIGEVEVDRANAAAWLAKVVANGPDLILPVEIAEWIRDDYGARVKKFRVVEVSAANVAEKMEADKRLWSEIGYAGDAWERLHKSAAWKAGQNLEAIDAHLEWQRGRLAEWKAPAPAA